METPPARPPSATCARCGAALENDGGKGRCPRCLLASGFGAEGQNEAERIFHLALSFSETERADFIANACGADAELRAEVAMLAEGHAEAAGEEGLPAFGTRSARATWAGTLGEEPGMSLGRYRLVRKLGEGGMGTVWEATQTEPVTRSVALKVIKLGMDTREVVARFERERQALALMQHPNIAQVFDAGATGLGRPYFVMELVAGVPITEYARAHALDVRARVALFVSVCGAVEHAHQKGVIHRDLKPSNILVDASGVPKVIDFGVAKATRDGGDPLQTRQAQMLGTPAYMSPEQAGSEGVDVDTRTDVYSLGVVLYELLSGSLPFDPSRLESTGDAEVRKILREETPPVPSTRVTRDSKRSPAEVRALRGTLRGDLDWIVMKALSKERERRYPSAAAFADDLRHFLRGEVVGAVPPTVGYRSGKFVRKNRLAVGAVAAIVLTLASALAISLRQVERANRALAGEGAAKREARLTVADLYTRSGISAADDGEDALAALWFANAALASEGDPERVRANRQRAEAWRSGLRSAVRAFDTGHAYVGGLEWNPRRAALIVAIENDGLAQVWDLEVEARRWEAPVAGIRLAAWHPSGDFLLASTDDDLLVLAYPSGREVGKLPGAAVIACAWDTDGERAWVASHSGAFGWDWRSGGRVPLSGEEFLRVRVSRDGRRILLQGRATTEIRRNEGDFGPAHPAVPSVDGSASDFLGDGSRYVTLSPTGTSEVRDSASGEIVESHAAGDGTWLGGSPDGRFFLRVGNGGAIDREAGGAASFPKHKNVCQSAVFSPDGRLLATGAYDNTLKLWSLPGGDLLGEIGPAKYPPLRAAFSHDGEFLASSERGTVRVWRAFVPALERPIAVDAPISLAAISPDGRQLAPAGFTNRGAALRRTRAYGIATGEASGPEIDPDGLIMDAAFSPDSAWLALGVSTTPQRADFDFINGTGSGNVQVWNPATGTRMGAPLAMPSEPRGVAAHPSGEWIGVFCGGGEGVEINVATRETRVLFRQDPAKTKAVPEALANNGRCRYSPDGKVFAAWGSFQFTHLWDRARARPLVEPWRYDTTSFDLDFSGPTVANTLVERASRLEFRDSDTGAAAAPDLPYTNWPMLGRFDPTGARYLAGGGDNAATVWDWRRGARVGPALSHPDAVMAGTFLPGGPRVATGGFGNTIRFWDYETGMPLRPPLVFPGWVLDLHVTADARTLVACGYLGSRIALLDLARVLPEPTLSPADALLLAEIDAGAEIFPGGGLVPFSAEVWMEKWRAFRQRHPDFPGHALGK